ncbi:hypothetical protein [Protaetiibacter intestinalis]|uniref:Uncharacterized protein n=1 Tax=Protaetiibacter intestinalis TaxID=2419774 RepID=A0A387BBE5_9MICO|nr:hypothetical protein [Protaetiibacter intestinalis]AYF98466.1 hypothetical protein D7I47_09495 [Protaetiibacter intestinalis]
MADLLVEIHVPLTRRDVPEGEYPFPWIDEVMEFLFELDGSTGEVFDDGEEWDGEYLFFVHGAPEAELISLARQVANLPGVPAGVYATVTDTEADMGGGIRVDLD